MKELTIKVNLTDDDTSTDVTNLLLNVMEVCGDNFYSIESADVDGREIFSVGKGICRDFCKKGE
ncbi:hypothetical protein [Anaerotignum sp.]|uniref:hypothetical protein n=1 Tax=Anaerotignum sp. TaxID=2039241 RepID=UPI0027148B70|nr:hypothetical protein [Anaerotignum sp.]